ncbi:hypothetical protein JHK87_040435 [Glycine soja]|nr:hypothetical protein JHK87_040435 [Glycine soja]
MHIETVQSLPDSGTTFVWMSIFKIRIWRHQTGCVFSAWVRVASYLLGNLGVSGIGGIIRDSNGSWVQGFAGLCGVKTNLYAELLAILKVLQMAWDYNGQALIYESNSRTALSLTLHGADHTHHYFPLISRIRSFLHHPWELSFQHEFREANYCADWLAKLGASSANHPLVFYSCPIAMAHL